MIEHADYVIDIGPAAGKHGGEIVSEGTPEELKNASYAYCRLSKWHKEIEIPKKRRKGNGKYIELKWCYRK